VGLLRHNRTFRSFWAARAVSQTGDGMALIALLLYVEETQEKGVAVAVFLLAETIPRLLGPLAGAVADRVDQRWLMLACDFGRAALYSAIAATLPPFPVLLVLVATASSLDTLFAPAGRSSVPALVARDDLMQANAWLGTAMNLQLAVGPAAGGLLTDLIGVRGTLAANALTFLISAAFLARLPGLPPSPEGEASQGLLRHARAGLAYARTHAIARAVVLSTFLVVSFAALDNVALVFLARNTLDAGAAGFGVLASAFGVGMLIFSLLLTSPRVRLAPAFVFLLGAFLSGSGTLLTGLAPTLALAVVVQALAGTGNAATVVGSDTLIQQTVPKPMLGRVFGLSGTAAFAGGGVAYAVGGILLDLTSARTVFLVAGGGVLGTALLARALLSPRGRQRRGAES
jgi:MFS family permease